MSIKEDGASVTKAPTHAENIKLPSAYQTLSPEARKKAIERIAKRRSDMPKIYRGIYDKAMFGNSLRAAINAQCLDCVMDQREEVRLCPSYPCPLWPYRPYQLNDANDAVNCSETPSQGPDSDSESTNAGKGDS